MQKFSPCLWVDGCIEEMIEVYTSVFQRVTKKVRSEYSPAEETIIGNVTTVSLDINNQEFILLDAGLSIPFSPAVTYVVEAATKESGQIIWDKLIEKGQILQPLKSNQEDQLWGWLTDQFGVSWQVMVGVGEEKITPCFYFTNTYYGRAKEALNLWGETFGNLALEKIDHNDDGTIKRVKFSLHDQSFYIKDFATSEIFSFTRGNSFYFYCQNQDEINHAWDIMTAVGEPKNAGWMKDPFGISWQTVTRDMDILFRTTNPKAGQLLLAFYHMQKVDIDYLRELSNT